MYEGCAEREIPSLRLKSGSAQDDAVEKKLRASH